MLNTRYILQYENRRDENYPPLLTIVQGLCHAIGYFEIGKNSGKFSFFHLTFNKFYFSSSLRAECWARLLSSGQLFQWMRCFSSSEMVLRWGDEPDLVGAWFEKSKSVKECQCMVRLLIHLLILLINTPLSLLIYDIKALPCCIGLEDQGSWCQVRGRREWRHASLL